MPGIVELANQGAVTRFVLVWLIQLIGAITVLAVLWPHLGSKDWHWDCFRIALFGAGVPALLLTVIVGVMLFVGIRAEYAEGLVVGVYVTNTFALALGMARTGGPSGSPFSPLMTIQLSGLLLLEQHREALTHSHSNRFMLYLLISVVAWLGAHYFRRRVDEAFHRKDAAAPAEVCNPGTVVWLSILGMALTAATYFVPRNAWFINLTTRLRID